MGNCFWCYFRQLFISLAFRKYIKDFHILIIILVQDICPLKTEIARFPIGFCLNLSGCKDKHPSCPGWAQLGECGKNPAYMLDNCCRSCRK